MSISSAGRPGDTPRAEHFKALSLARSTRSAGGSTSLAEDAGRPSAFLRPRTDRRRRRAIAWPAYSPPAATDWRAEWERFRRSLMDLEDRLQGIVRLVRLDSAELLSHLYCSLTGRRQSVLVPYHGAGLDVILGHETFVGDFAPVLGETETRVVGFQGYPGSVRPMILKALTEQAMEYRWSSRIRPLSPEKAEVRLREAQKHYYEKRHGAKSFAAQMARGKDDPGNPEWDRMQEDDHARGMAMGVSEAIALNSSGKVRYCEFNSYVVLHRASQAEAERDARDVIRVVRDQGFTAQLETVHAMEAFMGTLPGHGEPNVQRPLLSTENIAALLPLATAWAGPDRNPCQLYPLESPPLFWGDTDGTTPFRVCLHSGDVGHTLLIGPTGAGKSVVLQHIAAQAFRYPDAQVFVVDKGRSFELLARAAGGEHVSLVPGERRGVALVPFARVDEVSERARAMDLVEVMLQLQKVDVTPRRRETLNRVLSLLAADVPRHRTLTDFVTQVSAADIEMGQALEVYTVTGPYGGILDGEEDVLSGSAFHTYETDGLFDLSDAITLPVLLTLLFRLERRFDGRPTYLIVDEAASSLAHPLMERKIKEYAVTLRKKNVVLVLAFQDLHQLAELSSCATLMGSCPTRIFLPNSEALGDRDRKVYEAAGLNEQEIRLIADSTPKRHYYFKNPGGGRRFELALGAAARAVYFPRDGLNVGGTLKRAAELEHLHGPGWAAEWLDEADARDAAAWIRNRETERKSCKGC
jgi:type IV secretion/conjugal transfer VirB4 family ATPase